MGGTIDEPHTGLSVTEEFFRPQLFHMLGFSSVRRQLFHFFPFFGCWLRGPVPLAFEQTPECTTKAPLIIVTVMEDQQRRVEAIRISIFLIVANYAVGFVQND